jgi:branched-chain amino acid transport system permease protein
MAIVLFAPGGLAGLVLMHAPILRTAAFRGLLRAYGIALFPALLMLAGAVMLLEINYRLSTQPEAGTRITLLRVAMDAATPWPWLAAALMLVAGFLAFRRTWPGVAAAWQRATEQAAAGGVP